MIHPLKFTAEQKQLRRRICEISFRAWASHLGSCLSAVDIIDAIYKVKGKNEKFTGFGDLQTRFRRVCCQSLCYFATFFGE